MSASQTKTGPSGPVLRGSEITLETIMNKTDTSKRQTKIVCTLGPACWKVEQLESLIDAGLAIARFNFSHGDHEGHKACLDRLREAAANKKQHVGTYKQLSRPWSSRSRGAPMKVPGNVTYESTATWFGPIKWLKLHQIHP